MVKLKKLQKYKKLIGVLFLIIFLFILFVVFWGIRNSQKAHENQGTESIPIVIKNELDGEIINNSSCDADTKSKLDVATETKSNLETETFTKTETETETETEIKTETETEIEIETETEVDSELAIVKNSENQADIDAASIKDIVAKMKCTTDAKQIIIVVGNTNSGATLFYYKKSETGQWNVEFYTDADIGKNGITTEKEEGDGMTPAGCYPITAAFGIKENPGSVIAYQQIIETSYWVDDTKSTYYNQWADSIETGISFTSEHLIEHSPSYYYVLNIGYNLECIPGKGSAIFLHCKGGKGITTGCIGIEEEYMKQLITEVNLESPIVIVNEMNELLNY